MRTSEEIDGTLPRISVGVGVASNISRGWIFEITRVGVASNTYRGWIFEGR